MYGGPTISVGMLCEELAKSGQAITVYTTTANGKAELPVASERPLVRKAVQIYYFPRITKDHSHFSPALLWRFFRTAHKFDVIHIHSWWNLTAVPVVMICLMKGIRPVVSIRGMLSDYSFTGRWSFIKRSFHQLVGKHILRRCLLHVTSSKEEYECRKRLGAFRGFTAPNFLQFELPESEFRGAPDNPVFTVVLLSRIHPVKNLEFVFECFARVSFEFEIRIIGSGDPEYLESLKVRSETLGINSRIKWLGTKSGVEKFQLLASSDLFVQLSLTENFGNAIIEAAATGAPVLVSDQTGAAQYVRELGLGWVVGLNTEEVVDRLEKIYREKHERKAIRKTGQTSSQRFFSGPYLTKKYMDVYESLIEST